MSSTKYTSGPWSVQDMREFGVKHISVTAEADEVGTFSVATVAYPGIDVDDLDLLANAALISAAPELNAALQCLADTVCALLADGSIKIPDERLQWLENAAREGQRVLDKARGES